MSIINGYKDGRKTWKNITLIKEEYEQGDLFKMTYAYFLEDDGYWIRNERTGKIIATGLKLGIAQNLCIELNQLYDDLEKYRSKYANFQSELGVIQNELDIAIDNGFAPTRPYMDYMREKKTDYDNFWERKQKASQDGLK